MAADQMAAQAVAQSQSPFQVDQIPVEQSAQSGARQGFR